MLDKFKQLVDDVLTRLESGRDFSEDDIDRLIRAMRDELVQTKVRIRQLESDLQALVRQAEGELELARTAERRAGQARAIGDDETIRIADSFAAKHRKRVEVLTQKADAARADIEQHQAEAREGATELKNAIKQRDALLVRLRGARPPTDLGSQGHLGEAQGMADMADPTVGKAAADPQLERRMRDVQADDMLKELKRRMSRGR